VALLMNDRPRPQVRLQPAEGLLDAPQPANRTHAIESGQVGASRRVWWSAVPSHLRGASVHPKAREHVTATAVLSSTRDADRAKTAGATHEPDPNVLRGGW